MTLSELKTYDTRSPIHRLDLASKSVYDSKKIDGQLRSAKSTRERRVQEHSHTSNVRYLVKEQTFHAESLDIPMKEVSEVISSMRRQCKAVINANGGHTLY